MIVNRNVRTEIISSAKKQYWLMTVAWWSSASTSGGVRNDNRLVEFSFK